MSKIQKSEARNALWHKGILSWKLDVTQKELYKLYYESDFKVQTWLLSRRQGKTYTLCVLALEMCLQKPNSIVKFVSPTKIQVNNNVRPLFKKLLEDCPNELQPHFKANDYIYYFPNGSEIQLAGTDSKHAEKLRGGDSHAAFVDEAGSCDDLDNVVKSILLPTTLITKGKIILAGTPPADADHEFLRYIEEGESRGSLIKKTVHDNPRITKEQLEELEVELGGTESDAYKRELMCEIVKDPTRAVLPEFTKELEQELVQEWTRPPHFEAYESMDLGFKDLTVVLFAYYDFRNNKVVIEDELVVDFKKPNMGIDVLVKAIEDKEKQLWFNPLTNEQKVPYKRFSDINYIVTNEIKKQSNYKINFSTVDKTDSEAAINGIRERLQKRQIIINPRCEVLLTHMRNVRWRSADKSVFARSPDSGHYDAVDALKYLIRHVEFGKNPYPPGWNKDPKDVYIIDKEKYYGQTQKDVYRKIFNINQTPKKKQEPSQVASQNEKAREIIKKRWS